MDANKLGWNRSSHRVLRNSTYIVRTCLFNNLASILTLIKSGIILQQAIPDTRFCSAH